MVSDTNDGRGWRPRPATTQQQPDDFHAHFISQNVQGYNGYKEQVLYAFMRQRGVFLSCLQETWQVRTSLIDENAGFVVVRTNAIPPAGRGHASGGFAIVLSAPARRAWADASSYIARYGPRVMAVRLKIRDSEDKALDILVVCAYAPTSEKPAAEREEFLSQATADLLRTRPNSRAQQRRLQP